MTLTTPRPSDDRLHGLDALRGIALLLGVVLHTLMSFFPVPIWIVVDSETSPVASVLFFAIHLFRMTTFFLIAGLFAHMMLGRKGLWGFLRDRLIRIAGPLVGLWWPAHGRSASAAADGRDLSPDPSVVPVGAADLLRRHAGLASAVCPAGPEWRLGTHG